MSKMPVWADSGEAVAVRRFRPHELPAIDYAEPIRPELRMPQDLPARWAYWRFRDLDTKDRYRAKLTQVLEEGMSKAFPQEAETALDLLRALFGQLREHGVVVLSDLTDNEGFCRLIRRYHEIMEADSSFSFLHAFADLRRSSDLLLDDDLNRPILHPLVVALISYTIGGPVRIVDARAKDTTPLSVLAQDNMLHIDNTPFNDEYKVILTWKRGEPVGPAGQNFTVLPGTHKLARTCFMDDEGVPWSCENASVFTSAQALEHVFQAQALARGDDAPTVVEVAGAERPLTSVFAAGSLVHHRFRTSGGDARSAIIVAFHRVTDNPGRLLTDAPERSDGSLSELMTSGAPGDGYEVRFLSLLRDSAAEMAQLLSSWRDSGHPAYMPMTERKLSGERLATWKAATVDAPRVEEIKERALGLAGNADLDFDEFVELIVRMMRFDKHGPLDLILYHDNREECRKWARNLIREAPAPRIQRRLQLRRSQLHEPSVEDFLTPQQVFELADAVLAAPQPDSPQSAPPPDWAEDLRGMSVAEAVRSLRQALEDLAESVRRCENWQTFVSTSLFIFWLVDALIALGDVQAPEASDAAGRLLRHYTLVALVDPTAEGTPGHLA